ncbi:transcription factor [Phaffia rhodozyma]|uniref:Transcription factor n=1 Tax=Phaffia rhodozyma TaxID=264483 RepID=A0A0F7SII4_PHARH|nr:transcription factor [Phaffia rhodozyma]
MQQQQSQAHTQTQQQQDTHLCLWVGCTKIAPDPETLYNHLCNDHIGRKSTQNLCLTCHWKGCEITCAKRDHITSHLRVHTPLKPHSCAICNKTFKRPQDLKKHERIHTQEHHTVHKYSKAAVADDPDFGSSAKERRSSAGSASSRRPSLEKKKRLSEDPQQPDFSSPSSSSLSPNSASTSSLTTPPPLDGLSSMNAYPQIPNQVYPFAQNLYPSTGPGSLSQGPLVHPFNQNYLRSDSHPFATHGYGGAHGQQPQFLGQKRGLEFDGFFDDVKKRRVEPTYDQNMALRLEELSRNLTSNQHGGASVSTGLPANASYLVQSQLKSLSGTNGALPSYVPSYHSSEPHALNRTSQHKSLQSQQPISTNLNQTNQNYLDLFSQAPPSLIPEFRNEEEVAQTNTFLFNLLVGAMAVQGQNGNNQYQQQQHQQPALVGGPRPEEDAKNVLGAQQFDPALLAELGLTGMPGLDPGVLNADMQLQHQIENHRLQLQMLQQQQQSLHQRQTLNNQPQRQQMMYPSLSDLNLVGSDAHRPIAHLPSNQNRSGSAPTAISRGTNQTGLGMQTLLQNAPLFQTATHLNADSPRAAESSYDSTDSSSLNSSPHLSHQASLQHRSSGYQSSSSSDAFSNHTAFSPPSSHGLSPLSIVGEGVTAGSSPEDSSTLFDGITHPALSFSSLAKPRGASVSVGLVPSWGGDLRSYRAMEPLQAGAPLSTSKVDEHERKSIKKQSKTEDEPDSAEERSPSDVAMKGGPFGYPEAESLKLPSINNPDLLPPYRPRQHSIDSSAASSDATAHHDGSSRDGSHSRSASPASPSSRASTPSFDAGRRSTTAYSDLRSTISKSSTPPPLASLSSTSKTKQSSPRTQTLPSISSIYPSFSRIPAQSERVSIAPMDTRPLKDIHLRRPSGTEDIVGGLNTLRLAASSSSSTQASPITISRPLNEDETTQSQSTLSGAGLEAGKHIELIKALLVGINQKWRAVVEEQGEEGKKDGEQEMELLDEKRTEVAV